MSQVRINSRTIALATIFAFVLLNKMVTLPAMDPVPLVTVMGSVTDMAHMLAISMVKIYTEAKLVMALPPHTVKVKIITKWYQIIIQIKYSTPPPQLTSLIQNILHRRLP